jgi:RHS repeat-associated protein
MTTGLDVIYIYGATGRIAKKAGDETMYYHTDHLGSTRLLTDEAGTPLTYVGYYPFGVIERYAGEGEKYLFTGQETDSTGLYYYKGRYYDPETGRFLTRDRYAGDLKRPQSLNKYVYCMNNPLAYTDPSGNLVEPGEDPINYLEEMDNYLLSKDEGDTEGESTDQSHPYSDDPVEQAAYDLGYSLAPEAVKKFKDGPINSESYFQHFVDMSVNFFIDTLDIKPEDQQKFREAFEAGLIDGQNAFARGQYDGYFQEANERANGLLEEVRTEFFKCMWSAGFGITPSTKLMEIVYGIKVTYDIYGPVDTSEDFFPDDENEAGWGYRMVLVGMLIAGLIQKKEWDRKRNPKKEEYT